MRMEIDYNGKTYAIKSTDEFTAAEAKTLFYGNLENLNKLEATLENGEGMIMGEQAVQSAVIRFID